MFWLSADNPKNWDKFRDLIRSKSRNPRKKKKRPRIDLKLWLNQPSYIFLILIILFFSKSIWLLRRNATFNTCKQRQYASYRDSKTPINLLNEMISREKQRINKSKTKTWSEKYLQRKEKNCSQCRLVRHMQFITVPNVRDRTNKEWFLLKAIRRIWPFEIDGRGAPREEEKEERWRWCWWCADIGNNHNGQMVAWCSRSIVWCATCVPYAEQYIRTLLNSLHHSSNVHKSRHTCHNQCRNYNILPFRFVRNTHNHSKIWSTYANPSDDNLWCISQHQRQPHKKHPVPTNEKVMKIQAIRANSLDEREREKNKIKNCAKENRCSL